jgi:hypothetical protein
MYKKGVDNQVADALSRHIHEGTEELQVISCSRPVWMDKLVQGYAQDVAATNKLAQLAIQQPLAIIFRTRV